MRYSELTQKITYPIFTINDVLKYFSNEPENQINTQIHRLLKSGNIVSIKRGLYIFANTEVDEFVLANKIYSPSYVSMESVLNIYGVIPDIPVNVTSMTTVTPKKITSKKGVFLYSKIKKDLFFGYESKLDSSGKMYYLIASPEKALLDYIYVRKIKNLDENRINILNLNSQILTKLSQQFPFWVREVIKK